MRFLLFSLLISFINFSTFAALTINKITQSGDFSNINFNPLTNNKPAVLDGKIVYFNKQGQLTLSSGALDSTNVVQLNNQPLNASYGGSDTQIITVNNQILFINSDDNFTLWQTDGMNSSQLSDISLTYLTKDKGNVVHARAIEGNYLITTDGESVNSYELGGQLSFAQDLPVCEMEIDNLIFSAYDNNSNINFYRYHNGEVTLAAPEVSNEDNYTGIPEFKLMFAEGCYYQYETAGKSHILRIGIDGSVTTISSLDGEFNWINIFEFGGELYLNSAFRFGNTDVPDNTYEGGIFHLPLNSLLPEQVIGNSGVGLSIVNMAVSQDYLYFYSAYVGCLSCPIPSPIPPSSFQIYDKNLNLVRNEFRSRRETTNFEVFNIVSKDLMLFNAEVDKIVALNQGFDEFEIKTSSSEIDFILGDEQATYAIGTDRISQTPAIYKISDSILISNQLSGLWISVGLESQGLSIHTGIRPDGSEYMFVSFYIYKDGKPFWVAGSEELNLGSNTIEIDLFEFKGSSFLTNDANQNNERLMFGTLKIIPDTCDSIHIELEILNADNVNLDMQRITDVSHDNSCSD